MYQPQSIQANEQLLTTLNGLTPIMYFHCSNKITSFYCFSFSFPVEMMVVKPTGEVLVHYNANELLKVAEQDHIFTGAFS